MDLKYNVKEWGDINSVAPLTECSEKKPTFECHPQPIKVFEKVKEILNLEPNNKCENYLEILSVDKMENKINFNFKKTLNKSIKIEAVDVSTGLKRDKWEGRCNRLEPGNYWWCPIPGKLDSLGSIYLKLFVDGEYIDKILLEFLGGKKIIVNNEEYYFDNLDDCSYNTFWEIFIHNEYQFEGKNDIVLDIGANLGFFALYAIQNGAKKVYCVEPFPTVYENIKKLSKKLPIVPINKAVSSKTDNVTMVLNTVGWASNCLSEYNDIFNNDGEHIVVEPININDLIESIGSKIDLIKIDCEGSELDLFETITLDNLNKINKMVIETHSDHISNFIKEKLLNNNFEVTSKKGMFSDGRENILFANKIIK
jgi:FkbM family methyltransferase